MKTVPLELGLYLPLSLNAKYTIVTKLWGYTSTLQEFIDNESQSYASAYFTYYGNECRQTIRGASVPFHTHRQVLNAIVTISTTRIQPYDQLRELLEKQFLAFREASRYNQNLEVTLCLRLWMMMNVRDGAKSGSDSRMNCGGG
jgi:hypothetical protein